MKFLKTTQDKIVATLLLLTVIYLSYNVYDYKTSEHKRVSEILGSERAVDELTKILFNSTYPNIKRIGLSAQQENTILIIFRTGTDQSSVKALFPDNKYKQWDIKYQEE